MAVPEIPGEMRAGSAQGPARAFVGVAGWSLPSPQKNDFPGEGSHLARYSARLRAVEINSSFYRDHLPDTYARWADSTPEDFRFAVKLNREFTHYAQLAPRPDALRATLDAVARLGPKWGALLVQLPPGLALNARRADRFLAFVREHYPAPIAWEPRHPSWAEEGALAVLEKHGVARVLADPDPCPPSRPLSSDRLLRYYRLHGTPEIYRSRYRPPFLARVAGSILRAPARAAWCIFDNTTYGFALENALELRALLSRRAEERIVS